MFVVTLSKASVKKLGVGAMCCALVVFSAMLGRYISTRSVAVAAASNKIESAQDIQTWFTGYGLDVDGASITADKVKIPRKWDDSFSAFNGVVQQSGMDLARYKGKTVEKWTALIPAASRGDVSSYGVLLVYKKKAVGAYLLEKPSGTVTGLKDAQTAMALQEAEQVSGEDFSGDWGERHEDELTDGQAQQTSGEDFSGDWGERHDGELGAEGIDGIETALVTDLAVEGNFEVEAVDVLVEIEDIGLDGALAAGTDGRTDTNVAHSLELTAKGLGLNGIDTVARQKLQRLVKLDVRCRETDRAAEPVTRYDNTQQ